MIIVLSCLDTTKLMEINDVHNFISIKITNLIHPIGHNDVLLRREISNACE